MTRDFGLIRGLGKSLKPTLTSESYEVLRAAAAEGAVVAVLPSRVARRKADLSEIFLQGQNPLRGQRPGHYGIYLVCDPGCTTEENEFLTGELKSIISNLPDEQ